MTMKTEHVDVLIVGAGLSGIGAACHLRMKCPGKSFVLLEGRDSLGGTWDLFRYPGIRSDSDMFTFGYSFRPWISPKSIADGASILAYLRDTAAEYGVDQHIRFGHHVTRADWSSADAIWRVDVLHKGETTAFTCNFLFMCTGYYDYEGGHMPSFPGTEQFAGRIIHPQHWPADLDYAGKQVVIVGSGATAVTLVPALAKQATHVTMLQRSPTYIVARPSEDSFANWLRARLPSKLAYGITRWRNVMLGIYVYRLTRTKPAKVRAGIDKLTRAWLGPDYDIATHFTPRYNPWDQRLCLVPDGDLFLALRSGAASIVTDNIEHFTASGITLHSGKTLAADLVVVATGLKLKLFSGMKFTVDNTPIDLSKSFSYKGVMNSDVPNFATIFGYTNASWTLKSDLSATYVCRLLNHMDKRGYTICTPRQTDTVMSDQPFLDLTSGYIQRGLDQLPRQGAKKPWKTAQNYPLDLLTLRLGKIDDGTMEFSRAKAKSTV